MLTASKLVKLKLSGTNVVRNMLNHASGVMDQATWQRIALEYIVILKNMMPTSGVQVVAAEVRAKAEVIRETEAGLRKRLEIHEALVVMKVVENRNASVKSRLDQVQVDQPVVSQLKS